MHAIGTASVDAMPITPRQTKTPAGMGPTGVTRENTMTTIHHRRLLPRMVVVVTIKVKIIIRRR